MNGARRKSRRREAEQVPANKTVDHAWSGIRLLVTTSHYWPEPAGNAPYVAAAFEYLASRGLDVTVLTTFPHYPAWRYAMRPPLMAAATHEGVRVRRRLVYVPSRQSATHRAAYELSSFAAGLTGIGLRSVPDAIVAVSPDLSGALLARSASVLYRRPYGLILQDLMGLAAFESGVPGGRRVARAVSQAELRLASSASLLGVVAPAFEVYLRDRGVSTPIRLLRNWTLAGGSISSRNATRASLGWDKSTIVCLHAGNMGHKQGLVNLVESARLITDANIRIVLAGDGNERAALTELVARYRLRNVDFLPSQRPGAYEAMLEAADVLLLNQRAAVSDMSLPSKLTAYFAAGRAVVAAAASTSETAREIERAGGGVVVMPERPVVLAAAIAAIAYDPERREALGTRGARYAADVLASSALLPLYESFVKELACLRT